jgi:hypothetical protein
MMMKRAFVLLHSEYKYSILRIPSNIPTDYSYSELGCEIGTVSIKEGVDNRMAFSHYITVKVLLRSTKMSCLLIPIHNSLALGTTEYHPPSAHASVGPLGHEEQT